MTKITLLNGSSCQTEISLNDLFTLYNQVAQRRASVVIQAFWNGKEGGLDLRRLDPDATFKPQVQETEISSVTVYG